jgi:predicted transport protein
MPLYKLNEQGVASLSPRPLSKEKDLQNLVEKYLPELLGVWFLETEYATTTGGRIDTLGVDKNGSPVIIEYKKGQNDNVINQALSYRKWLAEQKSEFFEMLVMRKKLPDELSADIVVNWKKPRIICIAENFNRFDIDTVDVLSPMLAIELITYRGYATNIFSLEAIRTIIPKFKSTSAKNEELSAAPSDEESEALLEYHRSRGSSDIQKIFDELRARILPIGADIVERAVKGYIGYRASKNFAEVHIRKSVIALSLRGVVDDPQSRVTKVPDSHGWSLNQQVTLGSVADVDYVIRLIKLSYSDVS